jgi:hypothetical protein
MAATLDTLPERLFEELDHREANGIEVSLIWNRHDNTLAVFVFDARDRTVEEIRVRPDQAREAFEHPYAFVSRFAQPFASATLG